MSIISLIAILGGIICIYGGIRGIKRKELIVRFLTLTGIYAVIVGYIGVVIGLILIVEGVLNI